MSCVEDQSRRIRCPEAGAWGGSMLADLAFQEIDFPLFKTVSFWRTTTNPIMTFSLRRPLPTQEFGAAVQFWETHGLPRIPASRSPHPHRVNTSTDQIFTVVHGSAQDFDHVADSSSTEYDLQFSFSSTSTEAIVHGSDREFDPIADPSPTRFFYNLQFSCSSSYLLLPRGGLGDSFGKLGWARRPQGLDASPFEEFSKFFGRDHTFTSAAVCSSSLSETEQALREARCEGGGGRQRDHPAFGVPTGHGYVEAVAHDEGRILVIAQENRDDATPAAMSNRVSRESERL
ncbi:hypothetical protein B0H12DRAFT_1076250 [Mycena haematopus]|nr:hypothetical protein B0H12DRAFT_1076250 [Mycena haematopus]